jgi:hypothetical protein
MSKDSSDLLWDDVNRTKFYGLLTCASAGIRLCLYPAALVKTRLQASGAAPVQMMAGIGGSGDILRMPTYNSTAHAFRTILRTEGPFALYRGLRVNLLGLICDPIVIGTLEWSRTRLTYYSERFTPFDPNHYSSYFFKYVMSPSTAVTLMSAAGAACVGQIIGVPVDVITQKKQIQMHALQEGGTTKKPPPHT